MNAPDKIYIDDLAVVNDCVTKISLKRLPNFSEYIRKDALLEWIEEYRNVLSEFLKNKHSPVTAGKMYVLIKLLDKLNSM